MLLRVLIGDNILKSGGYNGVIVEKNHASVFAAAPGILEVGIFSLLFPFTI
jgi:hypothetical protein